MINFKKVYTTKIISIFIVNSFIVIYYIYSYPLNYSDALRVPVGEQKTRDRQEEALEAADENLQQNTAGEQGLTDKLTKLFQKTRVAVFDIDGTLIDEDRDINECPTFNALIHLLETGMPVYIITGNSLENAMRRVISYIEPNLRQNIIIYSARGVRVTGFSEKGEIVDHFDLVNKDSIINIKDYEVIRDSVKAIMGTWQRRIAEDRDLAFQFPGFYEGYYEDKNGLKIVENISRFKKGLRIDHVNEINGMGVIDMLVADMPSKKYAVDKQSDLRLEFISQLKRMIPSDILERIDFQLAYNASVLICRKHVNKVIAMNGILKREGVKPSEVVYFGDEFDNTGQDHCLLETGINCVAVDKDQTNIDTRAIKAGKGVLAIAKWIELLVQVRTNITKTHNQVRQNL